MNLITCALALAGIILGFTIGWARGKQQLSGAIGRAEYDKAVQEKTTLASKLESANESLTMVRSENTELHERVVVAISQSKALEMRLKEQSSQFENTATKLLENITTKFTTQSEKKIGDLLNPMQQHLNDFKKLVVESFTSHGKEQHTLKSEIEKIVLQTDGLTKALRGDAKAQGNWGEVMLERILEESGLRKGEDYITQGAEMGLTGAEGNRLQPDVVVKLPDGKHIIIDSKVSLTSYERYCNEPADIHVRDFLKSLRAHVNGLESKRYQHIEKLGAPDFVFMFMPTEGSFSFAMQHDPELHAYAWGKSIVIVPPSNLFANLRTIASLWRIESQNRNAQEIALQGSKLYDKFVGFIEDMQDIGSKMNSLQKSYDGAMNKLADGRGNLVGSVEKLRQLGANPVKSLPKELLGEEVLPLISVE